MLVTFEARRAQSVRWLLLLGIFGSACSLVVGELPPAEGGSPAGGASAGGDSGKLPPTSGTAGTSATAGTAGATTCDADHDGHKAQGPCGGDDCDDTDPDVFPKQPKYFPTRSMGQAKVGYDYNCDGKLEQEQQAPVVCLGVNLTACPTDEGFLGSLPACGDTGRWGKCVKGTLTCDESVSDAMQQMRCH
jgi:hypothetical protein